MNWRQVFKCTGIILTVSLILSLFVIWQGVPEDHGTLPSFLFFLQSAYFYVTVVLFISLVEMGRHVIYWGKHALWVVVCCWLGGLPLGLFLLRSSIADYM